MRYNLLGNGDHWFPGKNASEARSQRFSSVLEESPFADRIPDILAEAHEIMFEAPKQRLSQE